MGCTLYGALLPPAGRRVGPVLRATLFFHLLLSQEHIFKLMKSDSYARFLRSNAYQDLLLARKKVALHGAPGHGDPHGIRGTLWREVELL